MAESTLTETEQDELRLLITYMTLESTVVRVDQFVAARVQAAADERAERIAVAIEADTSFATLLPDRAAAAWHDALSNAAYIARSTR